MRKALIPLGTIGFVMMELGWLITEFGRQTWTVVGKLTTVTDKPDQTYRITILDSPNINAFALPGGYLYVTRGMLALANDSSEVAAVIAHEMGHVIANHGILRQEKEAETAIAGRVASEVLHNESASREEALSNSASGIPSPAPIDRRSVSSRSQFQPGSARPPRR